LIRRDIGRQPLLQRLHRSDVLGAGEIVLARPAGELALDVLALPPVVAQADGAVIDIVDARQHVVHRIEDPAAIGGRDAGHLRIGQDAAGQELHDVEGRADHRIVTAECVGLWYGDVGVIGQGLDHAVLAIDLVRRRQQLAGRLLAQHVHAAAAVSHMKGWIALPALELQHADRSAIAVDVGLHVVGQAPFVEDVGGPNGR